MKKNNRSFENFIVSECNLEAFDVCTSFAKNPFGKFLALCGPNGTGKTHLMSAIQNAFCCKFPNLKVKTATFEDIMSEYIELLRRRADADEHDALYENHINCDLLLIDNMQFIAGKSYTQEVFAEWFLRMLKEGKSVVIAFDRPNGFYDKLLEPLTSYGTVLILKKVDANFKNKYLSALLTETNFELPNVVKNTLVYDTEIPYYSFYGYISKAKFAQKLLRHSLTEEEFFECLSVYKHEEE